MEILTARDVPLGGPRAMTVRRTLPQRHRSLIGAWCFVDHYGPGEVSMDVAPHPHTGLQTVSWLFSGEIEHRDSLGSHALIRPGQLNLMTSGDGICHSEVSTASTEVPLHGVQLWVALPEAHRRTARDFVSYTAEPERYESASLCVFLGSLAGSTSPVTTFTPLVGAEIVLDAHARVELPLDPDFEHGVLLDTGRVSVAGTDVKPSDLAYLPVGASRCELVNHGAEPARLLLIGGEPFQEQILMWWNFVGRTHEEIVAFREAWQGESDQFGSVDGYAGPVQRLPAPALPGVTLKPRALPKENS